MEGAKGASAQEFAGTVKHVISRIEDISGQTVKRVQDPAAALSNQFLFDTAAPAVSSPRKEEEGPPQIVLANKLMKMSSTAAPKKPSRAKNAVVKPALKFFERVGESVLNAAGLANFAH